MTVTIRGKDRAVNVGAGETTGLAATMSAASSNARATRLRPGSVTTMPNAAGGRISPRWSGSAAGTGSAAAAISTATAIPGASARERGYREFGRPGQFFAASGYARGGFGPEDFERERGSRERSFSRDSHYEAWRRRQLDELDRDYAEYRREHQARFEDEFGSWRERRMQKRGLLGQIREHMEVIGNDDQHV